MSESSKTAGFSQFSAGTEDEPNEICLSLYFTRVAHKDMATRLMELLLPQVESWLQVPEYTVGVAPLPLQTAFIAQLAPMNFAQLYLLSVSPQLTVSAQALQLIINLRPGSVAEGWLAGAKWLREIVYAGLIDELKDDYLGYTITYRANLTGPVPEHLDFEPEVLQSLGLMHTDKNVSASKVITIQTVDDKGWLALVDYPGAPAEGLVYLAVGAQQHGKGLAEAAFAGLYAELTSMDCFVHKGLLEGQELILSYEQLNVTQLTPLRNSVDAILGQIRQNQINQTHLKEITQLINRQGELYWYLERSEQSLLQQIRGIKRLFAGKEKSPIAQQHLIRLEAYAEEVSAITAKNKLVLETGRFAVTAAQEKNTQIANRIQESFNRTIAVIGVFLATTQIFDSDFSKQILGLLFPIGEKEVYSYWAIFATRTISAVGITALIYGVFYLVSARRVKF